VRIRTPLCESLGIDVPIFSVGFGISATPELAAAVSNAGGCGVVGLGGFRPDEIPAAVARTRELTGRPFGGNVIIADLDEDGEESRAQVAASIEARVPVLVLFWGDPAPFVEAAHAAGVRLFVQVGSAGEAAEAAAAGVDAVIVQGVEAGGHVRATESIWTVLLAAVEAVGATPVLASGGIGDGTAVARALELGAQGVSLGTRFVASEEAWIHDAYKQAVVASGAADTFLGDLFDVWWPDAPHRTLKRKTYAEWDAAGRPPAGKRPREGEPIGTLHRPWGSHPWPRYATGMLTPGFEGDPDYAPMWAGESVDHVQAVQPAAEIVRELVRETEAALGGYSVTTYSNDAQQTSANTAS
jgi:NAD(P)H-dependent flavin oxidoreductase YrpB (nitropropane dioxygenase family)